MHHMMGEHAGAGGWGFIRGGMGAISEAIARSGRRARGSKSGPTREVARSRSGTAARPAWSPRRATRSRRRVVAASSAPSSLPAMVATGAAAGRIRARHRRATGPSRPPSRSTSPASGRREYTVVRPGRVRLRLSDIRPYRRRHRISRARLRRRQVRRHVARAVHHAGRCRAIVDDTIAPPGKHVVNLFGGHAPYALRERRLDDAQGRASSRNVLRARSTRFAPGFSRRHHRHAGADAARHRAIIELAARPHLPRRTAARPAVLAAPRAALRRLPQRRSGASISAAPPPIRAAASAASRATTPRARS